jgi:hypothetical protein
MITLDLEYSEKKEAEFIKKALKTFQDDISKKLIDVLSKLENDNNNNRKESNGSYFG